MDDHHFKVLLDWFGLSWQGYRKVRKGVKKRIARHMQQMGAPTVEAYIALLTENAAALNECRKRLTVSISRFFRDHRLWDVLEASILPEIISRQPAITRVWSAGCARGEEVYSFKIVWDRICQGLSRPPRLKLMASDMVPEFLEQAQEGRYQSSSLKDVPDDARSRYFEQIGGKNRYAIKPFIQQDIQWHLQDLLTVQAGGCFEIIFLRNNLLTYYQSHLQIRPFKRICRSLVIGGWLFVGSHEKLPAKTADFARHPRTAWAYQKIQ